jgi:hypothetical protein
MSQLPWGVVVAPGAGAVRVGRVDRAIGSSFYHQHDERVTSEGTAG